MARAAVERATCGVRRDRTVLLRQSAPGSAGVLAAPFLVGIIFFLPFYWMVVDLAENARSNLPITTGRGSLRRWRSIITRRRSTISPSGPMF